MSETGGRDIVVAVCTYNRNAELAHLLDTLLAYGASEWAGLALSTSINEPITPRNVTIGATVFTDMISASSGTVTPPKPVLPRIA